MAKRPLRRIRPGPLAERRKGRPASEAELRKLFNESGIPQQIKDGELRLEVTKDGHPSPPLADEPICTRSQIVSFFDNEHKEIARCHRYVRPDGSLGASKLLDPKMPFLNGILYYSEKL